MELETNHKKQGNPQSILDLHLPLPERQPLVGQLYHRRSFLVKSHSSRGNLTAESKRVKSDGISIGSRVESWACPFCGLLVQWYDLIPISVIGLLIFLHWQGRRC